MRIEFDAIATPAGLLGCEQRGAAASECVQNNATSFRAVENGVADKHEGFRRRMPGKCGVSVLPKTAHACVLPNIRSASPEASEFDVVDVLGSTVLVDEYEFVGRSI